MTRLPVPACEPRHHSGGAGGAGRGQDEPSWYRQKVKVPKRVWGSGRYSPGAVAWHAQITALQQRPEHCRASVATLARYMGDAKRTGERYLRELSAPGPDGIPELTTVRKTASDGDGETAQRYTRPLARGEHFAYVPVAAAKALRHPLFVLYCALAYTVATRTPVTAAELASLLGVTEMTLRRMTTELERLGWLTVHRRTGAHGRNEYEVHDRPLHPAPGPPRQLSSDGGSGASADGGSLAIKEDAGLTDGEETGVGGSVRRRRSTGSYRPEPVDTFGNTLGGNYPVAPAALRTAVPPPRCSYDGPQPTLPPLVWWVLEPVRDLLPGISPYLIRRIARDVGHQLDEGTLAEDLRDQIQIRRARTPTETIHDPGRWLLGAALAHWPSPCGLTDCVDGFMRHTGRPCKACAERPAHRGRQAHPPHTSHPGPHACTDCGWTSPTPLPHNQCVLCRTA